MTKFGTPCLRWDHPGIDSVYSSGNEHGNYCRSPDSTPFLICFILDKKGVITDEKCDVPECTGCKYDLIYSNVIVFLIVYINEGIS